MFGKNNKTKTNAYLTINIYPTKKYSNDVCIQSMVKTPTIEKCTTNPEICMICFKMFFLQCNHRRLPSIIKKPLSTYLILLSKNILVDTIFTSFPLIYTKYANDVALIPCIMIFDLYHVAYIGKIFAHIIQMHLLHILICILFRIISCTR